MTKYEKLVKSVYPDAILHKTDDTFFYAFPFCIGRKNVRISSWDSTPTLAWKDIWTKIQEQIQYKLER